MKTYAEFAAEKKQREEAVSEWIKLYEHETYKPVPGSKSSYRVDYGAKNARTVKHSHVYAKPKGEDQEIYVVNVGGSEHDGSSGIEIPTAHADYFRSLGYDIDSENTLESLDSARMDPDTYELLILVE